MRGYRALGILLMLAGPGELGQRAWAGEEPSQPAEIALPPELRPEVESGALEMEFVEAAGRPQCGPPGRVWLRAEVLAWWLDSNPLPALITASPPGTTQAQAGVLGTPGTAVLFGNERENNDIRAGTRINAGVWFDRDQIWGFEYTALYIEPQSAGALGQSNGDPILARPFYDATTGLGSSELVAFPGVLAGGIGVSATSGSLVGHEFLLRENLCCFPRWRLDALAGLRYLRYKEGLNITENLFPNGPLDVPGTNILLNDSFQTLNEFLGAEMGLTGEFYRDRWFLDWRTTFSLGETNQSLGITGSTVVFTPGAGTTISPGGLLALQSNIGTYRKGRVAVVPELSVHVGRQITSWMRVRAGYTFLYWSDIIRAGDQVDLVVNPNLIPPVANPVVGPARPALPNLIYGDLIAQGLDFSLELRY